MKPAYKKLPIKKPGAHRAQRLPIARTIGRFFCILAGSLSRTEVSVLVWLGIILAAAAVCVVVGWCASWIALASMIGFEPSMKTYLAVGLFAMVAIVSLGVACDVAGCAARHLWRALRTAWREAKAEAH